MKSFEYYKWPSKYLEVLGSALAVGKLTEWERQEAVCKRLHEFMTCLGLFVWWKSISSPLNAGKLYFASSRWHDNGCWQLESRGYATMEWKIALQSTSSCAWKCCFVTTILEFICFSCNRPTCLLVMQQGSKFVILAPHTCNSCIWIQDKSCERSNSGQLSNATTVTRITPNLRDDHDDKHECVCFNTTTTSSSQALLLGRLCGPCLAWSDRRNAFYPQNWKTAAVAVIWVIYSCSVVWWICYI